MSNVNTAHFWQIDHQIKHMAETSHTLIIPSPQAWDKYLWTRQYFESKPKEGYFVWIKNQPDCPLLSCVSISDNKINQQMNNLLVVEPGLDIELSGTCNSLEQDLGSTHKAKGKIVIKQGSKVNYVHIHSWGLIDKTTTNYHFILEKKAQLTYTYRSKYPPKRLTMQTKFNIHAQAKAKLNIFADLQNTDVKLHDTMFLLGKDASGISKIRLIGRKNAKIKAYSKIVASQAGQGHLECDGLILDKTADIGLVPELVCQHTLAKITHEASIGKVSDEQINYLRMRGLTHEQALDLIVAGFLK